MPLAAVRHLRCQTWQVSASPLPTAAPTMPRQFLSCRPLLRHPHRAGYLSLVVPPPQPRCNPASPSPHRWSHSHARKIPLLAVRHRISPRSSLSSPPPQFSNTSPRLRSSPPSAPRSPHCRSRRPLASRLPPPPVMDLAATSSWVTHLPQPNPKACVLRPPRIRPRLQTPSATFRRSRKNHRSLMYLPSQQQRHNHP